MYCSIFAQFINSNIPENLSAIVYYKYLICLFSGQHNNFYFYGQHRILKFLNIRHHMDGGSIYSACEGNQYHTVKMLIEEYTVYPYNIDSCLEISTSYGNMKLISLLLNNGAVINTDTILQHAVRSNKLKVYQFFLEKEAVESNDLLYLAARHKSRKMIKFLSKKFTIDTYVDNEFHLLEDCFKIAIDNSDSKTLKLLAKIYKKDIIKYEYSLMRAAISNSDIKMLKHLLRNKRIYRIQKSVDFISQVSLQGNNEMIKLLIEYKHKIGSRSVSEACINGHIDTIVLLLENGAKIGKSALLNACENNHYNIVVYLLNYDPYITKEFMYTLVCNSDNDSDRILSYNIMEFLIEKNYKSITKQTIKRAIIYGRTDMLLLFKRYHIDISNSHMMTVAASIGHLPTMKFLIEQGGKFTRQHIWHALRYTRNENKDEILRYILSFGIKLKKDLRDKLVAEGIIT